MTFSEPQEYIVTSTQEFNLFLAGVGSGKTHIIGASSGYYVQNFPDVFGFIGANTHAQLTTSTLFRVREVWQELYGWKEGRDYVVGKRPPKSFDTENHNFDDYGSIISFKTGAVVFKGSLDNAKAHDGKEFGWAFLDETKDSREEDVKDVIMTRMRMPGMYINAAGELTSEPGPGLSNKGFNPLYILTSPAKVQWINEWFELDEMQTEIQAKIYDKEDFYVREFKDKCVVISSTYHNEANLPKGYIERIINNQSEEGAKRLIYGNPFVKAGGEFYSGFKRMSHVKKVPIIKDHAFHISFDQNVVPYITMCLFQVVNRTKETEHLFYSKTAKKQVRQFSEICLKNPKNKTSKLCMEFIRLYGSLARQYGLFYYGDPSGRRSDTRGEHDYKIVDRVLRRYLNNASNRVPVAHPPVLKRKDFANNIFEGVYDEIEFVIDESCKKSITDFEFVKEDANGKKLKEKGRDDAGRTFEKYGHTSDAFDYFITRVFARLFARFFK